MPKFIITDGYGTQVELLPENNSIRFVIANSKNTSYTPKHKAETIFYQYLSAEQQKYFSIVNITQAAISKRGTEKAKNKCRKAMSEKMKKDHISIEEVFLNVPYTVNKKSNLYKDLTNDLLKESKLSDHKAENREDPENTNNKNEEDNSVYTMQFLNDLGSGEVYDCDQLRTIIKFLNVFAKNVAAEVNELNKMLIIANRQIQDIHHYLEIKELSEEDELVAVQQLKDILRGRRMVKDTLTIAKALTDNPIINEKELINVNKSMSGMINRNYNPRQLKDLFK